MIQFQFMAPWIPTFSAALEAEQAAKDNKPPFVLFTLATVDKDGFPHNRTMVFRGFLFDNKSNNVLTFCTDRRMKKYEELLANDKFEAVFYFEKIKKQFRLRGRARLIDQDHYPVLDLTTIQPRHIIETSIQSMENSSDESGDELELAVAAKPQPKFKKSHETLTQTATPDDSGDTEPLGPQKTPLPYPIVSPTLLDQLLHENEHNNSFVSYSNLHELGLLDLTAPTDEEWDGEISRVWQLLSKGLKLSFRRPAPLLPMDDTNQNLVDKILRGVDGKKEETGLKNFAVVGMFVDHVDYYDMEKNRRYLYDKDQAYVWNEMEVCP